MPVTAEPTTTSAMVLSDLMKISASSDSLAVSNSLPGIVIFHDEQLKTTYEWTAKGDPNGKDVVDCSPELLKNPRFREHVLRGIFVIESAPEVLQTALDAQKADWDARLQNMADSQANLEKAANRVVAHGQSCIAPKGSKGVLCGNVSLVMGINPNEQPPLCAEHAHMRSQYVATASGRVVNNKEEMTWKRVQIAQRG